MVFQSLNWKIVKENTKFEVFKPVIGCSQSTLKGCRSFFPIYSVFYEFRSTGGTLHASFFKT